MDALLVIFLLIITFPIASLFHEWGHTVSAKLLGLRVTRTQLGTGKPLSRWNQGTTEVQFNWNCFLGGFSVLQDEENQPKFKRMVVILSGLFVSFGLYLLCWEIYKRLPLTQSTLLLTWLYIFTVINLYMGVVQLFPFRKGVTRTSKGHPSDGLALLHLLTQKSPTPAQSTAQPSQNNTSRPQLKTHKQNRKDRK